jgi:two-component system cell cycle sensor histidine kinase/response regulator CckA
LTAPLRFLLLEDVPIDAELIERELGKTFPDFTLRRVDGRDSFLAGLDAFGPDLILSDHALPRFTGMDALRLAQQLAPTVPFIFVTGSLDEETAVACIKAGATDYVLKERLVRLGPAVQAALELARTRDALRKSEEQLLHAQKLDAIGRLAGGVAHDFNNIITAILGYCDLMRQDLARDDPRRADLEEINSAAERAATLTRQLLAFSRRQVLELQPVHLNEVVTEMDKMLRRVIGEDVDLVIRPDPSLGWVRADPGQIEQVIMNLVVNARDAMPGGGAVTIETANVTLGEHTGTDPAGASGPHVMLAVSDTGTGMDAETRARLFEPFFTTKQPGKGTGLGLATVYGIVRQSGGSVYVYSEPGRGTSFKIYLPEVAPPSAGRARASPSPARLNGDETVLLVEDEGAVRDLARKVLEAHGYTVLEAACGAAALRLSDAHANPIHVLVTDVVMPEMSGRELAQHLAGRRPKTRVLFMSGYTDDAVVRHGVLAADVAYLQKPFTPEGLLKKLRAVLDGDAPPQP